MKTIICKFLEHRGKDNLALHFENDNQLVQSLRKKMLVTWSKQNSCWYCDCNRINFEHVKQIAVENDYTLDYSLLKSVLQSRAGATLEKNVVLQPQVSAAVKTGAAKVPAITSSTASGLSVGNAAEMEKFKRYLILKSYSKSTIRTYSNELMQFFMALKDTAAGTLDHNRIKDYLHYCHKDLRLSEATLHSRTNALKFYYEQVLKKEKFFYEIPRPKKPLMLPKVFNQDEVADIINSMLNKKHKVMLMMAYSAGLRVSEVVALKTYNIDSKRMCILIEQAKGKKDRMVTLSPVLLVMLREYAALYKPSTRGYLFEGLNKATPYSTRSLQQVIQLAKKKAGIIKPGSIHSLRHSFATHLLDKGTDITMIQKLLGHNEIKTTLRYLHTTNKDLLKIISPLDNLNLQ